VGLGHKSIGSVQLGAQWVPSIWLTGRTDPFQRGQMGAQFTVLQGAAVRGYAVQYPNAIQYITPNISGLQGRALFQLREGAAAANRAFAVDYTGSNFYVGLVYDSTELAGASLGVPARPSVRSNNLAVGAFYIFPMIKLFGYAQNNRVDDLPNVTGYMAGAAVPVGVGEFRLSFSHNDNPTASARMAAVGYNHFLSKRTQLYVTAADVRNDGTARFGLFPSSSAGLLPVASQDVRGVQTGIRHTF
jgi:predicted porin